MTVRIQVKLLRRITEIGQERNIYVHPNPLARDIFWQRLEALYAEIQASITPSARLLDFGGGSGVFAPALSTITNQVDIVDIDCSDARSVCAYFQLNHINLFEADVTDFAAQHANAYDAIIAADVLEHFAQLTVPTTALQRLLKPGGLLFTSLPTENQLYVLGRILVRKQKPVDHYHSAAAVVAHLQQAGFKLLKESYRPRYFGIPIPLFRISVLRWDG